MFPYSNSLWLVQATTWSTCYAGYICYPIICWCQVINVVKSPPDEQQRLGQNVIRQKRCSYPPSWQIGLLLLESHNHSSHKTWETCDNVTVTLGCNSPATWHVSCVTKISGCSLKVAHSALIHCACLLRLFGYNCFCIYIDNKLSANCKEECQQCQPVNLLK